MVVVALNGVREARGIQYDPAVIRVVAGGDPDHDLAVRPHSARKQQPAREDQQSAPR